MPLQLPESVNQNKTEQKTQPGVNKTKTTHLQRFSPSCGRGIPWKRHFRTLLYSESALSAQLECLMASLLGQGGGILTYFRDYMRRSYELNKAEDAATAALRPTVASPGIFNQDNLRSCETISQAPFIVYIAKYDDICSRGDIPEHRHARQPTTDQACIEGGALGQGQYRMW